MIRDTSNQDVLLARAERRSSPGPLMLGALGVLAVAAVIVGVQRWGSSTRSVDRDRIRIAEVARGTLVRDIVADARVTAANNPTLYAVADGIVTFRVQAGDPAAQG